MDMREWAEIPDLAIRLHIPDRTLRRYLERHGPWIEAKRIGRRHLVAERSVNVLERIRDLYNAGKTAEEVDADLTASSLPVTIDVPGMTAVTVAEFIQRLAEEMNSLRSEVDSLHAQLAAAREDQGQSLTGLEQRLAERDQRLMQVLEEIRNRNRRPWWWPFGGR